jgi:hypothetical protein
MNGAWWHQNGIHIYCALLCVVISTPRQSLRHYVFIFQSYDQAQVALTPAMYM